MCWRVLNSMEITYSSFFVWFEKPYRLCYVYFHRSHTICDFCWSIWLHHGLFVELGFLPSSIPTLTATLQWYSPFPGLLFNMEECLGHLCFTNPDSHSQAMSHWLHSSLYPLLLTLFDAWLLTSSILKYNGNLMQILTLWCEVLGFYIF